MKIGNTGLLMILAILASAAVGQPPNPPGDPTDDVLDETRVPRVTEITPASGDERVDPSVTEIRVRFDMPMSRGGYSFTGGGAHFPHPTGEPRWEDAYTCVLPVNLKPNWAYRFGINSATRRNFRSVYLVPAEPVEHRFKTGGLSLIVRSPDEQRKLNVESYDALCEALRTRYSYFDLRELDWETRFAERRPSIVGSENDAMWAQEAADMLALAGDIHLLLEFDGTTYPTTTRRVKPNWGRGGVVATIGSLDRLSQHVFTTKTPGGIGYLQIGTWASDAAPEIERIHEALATMRDTIGIILDVRPNSGGSEKLARDVAGWFVDARSVYAKHTYRRGPGPQDFTPIRERVISPHDEPRRYAGPVVVLMGRTNVSSCEAFLLMMKQAPRATLVGEKSFGSSGNPKTVFLPNGAKAMIPSWRAMRPDESVIEGSGIMPDVVVPAAGVDFDATDPVLQTALNLLRNPAGEPRR